VVVNSGDPVPGIIQNTVDVDDIEPKPTGKRKSSTLPS
jgi:hypothetical protein